MGLRDPVLIRYNYKYQAYTLHRGKETFFHRDLPDDDPRKDQIRTSSAQKAREWSVANLGVDPMARGSEAQEIRTLPLFSQETGGQDGKANAQDR